MFTHQCVKALKTSLLLFLPLVYAGVACAQGELAADNKTNQDSGASQPTKSPADEPAPNSLKGLFTPQPQYPSVGITQMNPEPLPKHLGDDSGQPGMKLGTSGTVYYQNYGKEEGPPSQNKDNPLKGLFTPQPQYPSVGITQMNPEPLPRHLGDDSGQPGMKLGTSGTTYSSDFGKDQNEPSGNKDNVLKGFFTPQPQYPSVGITQMNPEPLPKHLGDDSGQPGRTLGTSGPLYQLPSPSIGEVTQSSENQSLSSGTLGQELSSPSLAEPKLEAGQPSTEGTVEPKEQREQKEPEGKKEEPIKEAGAKAKAKDNKEKETSQVQQEPKAAPIKYEPYNPLKEAIILMNSSKYQQSLAILTKLLARNPNNAQALYTRAVLYVAMRQYAEATSDYKQVMKLVPQGELFNLAKIGLSKL